jgi:uncharacterized membrane protein (DUF4010 family)
MIPDIVVQLGVSLGLGLLVGMQRERTEASVAGVRTFPLITMFGTVCARLSAEYGGWISAAGLVALAALVIAANIAKLRAGEIDPGVTTEVATVLLYAVGALAVLDLSAAVIVGGVVALLLHHKAGMHRMVGAIGDRDVRAIMQFVLISLVILPVLPNRTFGPYDVLNPFKIWLMVVLIVGISLSGYVAFKLLGGRAGALIGGVLGGVVSSTATTASYARLSTSGRDQTPLFAAVIVIASTVVFARVLILIAAVAAHSFASLAIPIATMLGAMVVLSAAVYFLTREKSMKPPDPENPAELKPALIFGALYAAVLIIVKIAQQHFGSTGLYTVAIISGLTDMDAITLSTSQLVGAGQLEPGTGWRTILLASMSNIVFKAAMVAILGTRLLLAWVGVLFAIALSAGGAILWLWPG